MVRTKQFHWLFESIKLKLKSHFVCYNRFKLTLVVPKSSYFQQEYLVSLELVQEYWNIQPCLLSCLYIFLVFLPGENLMNYSWKIHEFCSWTSIKSTWTLHECAWTLNGTVHESNSSWIISSWTFLFMNSSWTNVHAFLKSKSWAIFMNFSWIFSWTLNGTVHENCCSWILHDLVIMNISWIIHE